MDEGVVTVLCDVCIHPCFKHFRSKALTKPERWLNFKHESEVGYIKNNGMHNFTELWLAVSYIVNSCMFEQYTVIAFTFNLLHSNYSNWL